MAVCVEGGGAGSRAVKKMQGTTYWMEVESALTLLMIALAPLICVRRTKTKRVLLSSLGEASVEAALNATIARTIRGMAAVTLMSITLGGNDEDIGVF